MSYESITGVSFTDMSLMALICCLVAAGIVLSDRVYAEDKSRSGDRLAKVIEETRKHKVKIIC